MVAGSDSERGSQHASPTRQIVLLLVPMGIPSLRLNLRMMSMKMSPWSHLQFAMAMKSPPWVMMMVLTLTLHLLCSYLVIGLSVSSGASASSSQSNMTACMEVIPRPTKRTVHCTPWQEMKWFGYLKVSFLLYFYVSLFLQLQHFHNHHHHPIPPVIYLGGSATRWRGSNLSWRVGFRVLVVGNGLMLRI